MSKEKRTTAQSCQHCGAIFVKGLKSPQKFCSQSCSTSHHIGNRVLPNLVQREKHKAAVYQYRAKEAAPVPSREEINFAVRAFLFGGGEITKHDPAPCKLLLDQEKLEEEILLETLSTSKKSE